MNIAIATTSTLQAGTQSGGSAVTLQAQLDRCNKQLSDWVDCSSGKTPEGKQIIAALQEKISTIKQQIQQNQTQGSTSGSTSGGTSGETSSAPPVSLALASLGTVGTLLNTQA